jgi:hypothetical protein
LPAGFLRLEFLLVFVLLLGWLVLLLEWLLLPEPEVWLLFPEFEA